MVDALLVMAIFLVTLVLPGFTLSALLYDRDQIGFTERFVVSLGLSIVIIPILSFALFSLRLLPVNQTSIIGLSAGLTVVSLAVYGLKRVVKLKSHP